MSTNPVIGSWAREAREELREETDSVGALWPNVAAGLRIPQTRSSGAASAYELAGTDAALFVRMAAASPRPDERERRRRDRALG